MKSSSYGVVQSEIGGIGCDLTGATCGASNSYNLGQNGDGGSTLGESAVGNSSSTNYQSNAGFNTAEEPGLALVVNSTSVNLGALLTSGTAFDSSATFDVSDYTSYGYVVQVIGNPPSVGSHSLATTSNASPTTGTEQFGMNLVANTGNGANPQEIPSSSYSFGEAGNDCSVANYGTANCPYSYKDHYSYSNGDVIASSPKTSGDTKYTITFMANISTLTPPGLYTGNIALVATGTY